MNETQRLSDVTFGGLTVRPMYNEAILNGHRIKLQPYHVEILNELARAKGKPLTVHLLCRALSHEGNQRRNITGSTMASTICMLRCCLKGTGVTIKTAHDFIGNGNHRGPGLCGYYLEKAA